MDCSSDQPLPPGALAALQQGRTIEAIKIVREVEGLGLKEAKDRVEQHVAGGPVGLQNMASSDHPVPSGQPLPPGALAALQQGRTIEAIKIVREVEGLGLKEAKDRVEQHVAGGPILQGQSDTGRVRGCLLLLALLGGVAAFLYFRARG